MKNWMLLLILAAVGLAFYEQSKPKPSPIIMAVAVAIFMFGIMKFSSKLPSKHKDENDDDVSKRG
ncbi:hypothetical protein [Flavobacterium agri]|nr:hypothetical protein [Flavobacterium agri]